MLLTAQMVIQGVDVCLKMWDLIRKSWENDDWAVNCQYLEFLKRDYYGETMRYFFDFDLLGICNGEIIP